MVKSKHALDDLKTDKYLKLSDWNLVKELIGES